MKLRIRLVHILPACALLTATPAGAQSALELGRNFWKAALYPLARPPLLTYRSTRGGRTAEVDYMLGTSGCRISGMRPWGARVLNYILYSYPLSRNGRGLVHDELQRCRSTATLAHVGSMSLAMLAPGATASGKLFYMGGGRNPVLAHPARLKRPFAPGELARRHISLDEPGRYQTMLQAIVPAGAKVKVIGRFGFVSVGSHTDAQLKTISNRLQRYSDFLQAEFGLAPPDEFVTVYLSPDIPRLTALADKVHHLEISPSTLGYAYPDDSSVAGMVPAAEAGTLLHEMFHLYLRDSYGDMPQWLDEGMASLYEVSRSRNGKWEGLPNWRGRLLQTSADQRPSLREVIRSPWFNFDGVSGGADLGIREQRQLALARYFALYLQTRGLLDETFNAFRDREIGAAEDPADEAVQLVERVAGPLSVVEPTFWAWFASIGSRDDNYLPGVDSKALPNTPG